MAKKRTKKGKVKKSKKQKFDEKDEDVKAPHSFVIKKGPLVKSVNELMLDVREVLQPFTATNLHVRRRNTIRDFVSVASPLNVTHILMFQMRDKFVELKLARLPHGPTVTFRVNSFTTGREVRSGMKRPVMFDKLFQHQPLLVMNGFSGGVKHDIGNNESGCSKSGHNSSSSSSSTPMQLKLCTSMWRNLFPAFDISTVNLNDIKRCVLLNYDPESETIDFRHYAIRVKPIGLKRVTKKIIRSNRKVPDLGKFKDISDVVESQAIGSASESEGEEEEFRKVTVCQKIPGNLMHETSAVRLSEIGPRINLNLFKIEEGLMEGNVLWSSNASSSNTPSASKKTLDEDEDEDDDEKEDSE